MFMGRLKHGEKCNYSTIEVYELNGQIFKAVKFHFDNIFFGVFDDIIKKQKSEKRKYKILAKIFSHLVKLGLYPPPTKFKIRGDYYNPVLAVKMTKLFDQAQSLPKLKIKLVERYLKIPKLFYDVYHLHNYYELHGETYFTDIEVFPKKN